MASYGAEDKIFQTAMKHMNSVYVHCDLVLFIETELPKVDKTLHTATIRVSTTITDDSSVEKNPVLDHSSMIVLSTVMVIVLQVSQLKFSNLGMFIVFENDRSDDKHDHQRRPRFVWNESLCNQGSSRSTQI